MANLSIFGTHSDAGKSTLTWLMGRLLQEQGLSVAPFKAQNVSNNAHVADDGSEIAVAQQFQATALGVPTSWHVNPVLLKSGRGSAASLIVRGEAVRTQDVREYYRDIDTLKPIVSEAFAHLDECYDVVIAEGAGSPVELNLMDKDLSNLYIATEFDTRIILVADIEKGGVFASIYGVYHLLPEPLRDRVIGVVVNKFRGDRSLFDEGVRIIEERFGIPVLGVLPYVPFNLGFEDSQSLMGYAQWCRDGARQVAVIAYPTMSNYTDFEPLLADEDVCVTFVRSAADLSTYDTVIMPGSKLLLEDLAWLRNQGFAEQIEALCRTGVHPKSHTTQGVGTSAPQSRVETLSPKMAQVHWSDTTRIIGICGGYEMLHERIEDPEGVESAPGSVVEGLGIIPGTVRFERDKIVHRHGERYEIHHGISTSYPDGYATETVLGTFEHGWFADETFVAYRRERITAFVDEMRPYLDVERVLKAIVV